MKPGRRHRPDRYLFEIVKREHTLHLSGTPFKALANQKFATDAIFNWTYLDEQKAKQAELDDPSVGDSGPHADLPDLRLYTYRISQMIASEVNEGIEISDETRDYAFDLNEFFATKNQKFVHKTMSVISSATSAPMRSTHFFYPRAA